MKQEHIFRIYFLVVALLLPSIGMAADYDHSVDFNGDGKSDLLFISGDDLFTRQVMYLSIGSYFNIGCVGQEDGACGLDVDGYTRNLKTRTLFGDFDGDGKTDILVISGDSSFPWRKLYLSTGSSFNVACAGQQGGACGLDKTPYMRNPRTRMLTGDFNSDGKTDLLIISGDDAFTRRILHLSTGIGFSVGCVGEEDGACGLDNESYMRNPRTRMLAGDYNGDEKTDVLVISGDDTFTRRILYLSTGSGFSIGCVGEEDGACGLDSESYMRHPRTRMLTGDYNGDGKADVLVISGQDAFTRRILYLSTGSGFSIGCVGEEDGACGLDSESYMRHPRTRMLTGDYNGDGKTDVLVISGQDAFTRRILYLSTGSGFSIGCVGEEDGTCGLDSESYMRHPRTRMLTGDYNGDGKTDVLVISGQDAFTRRILYLSTGSGFSIGCVGEEDGACGLDNESYTRHRKTSVPRYDIGHGKKLALGGRFIDSKDLTDEIQYALDGNYGEVLLDGGPGTVYLTRPLSLRSNQTFTVDSHVALEAVPGAYTGSNDSVLTGYRISNTVIKGFSGSVIRMQKDEYQDYEWRHGIQLFSSSDIEIHGLRVEGSGGDGIYLGVADQNKPYNENIHIYNVDLDDNSRNALSIIGGVDVLIENSYFTNTHSDGAASNGPWAGIDIEPNHEYEKIQNIVVRNSVFEGNERYGLLCVFNNLSGDSDNVSILFENNVVTDSCVAAEVSVNWDSLPTGVVTFRGNNFSNNCGPTNLLGEDLPELIKGDYPLTIVAE